MPTLLSVLSSRQHNITTHTVNEESEAELTATELHQLWQFEHLQLQHCSSTFLNSSSAYLQSLLYLWWQHFRHVPATFSACTTRYSNTLDIWQSLWRSWSTLLTNGSEHSVCSRDISSQYAAVKCTTHLVTSDEENSPYTVGFFAAVTVRMVLETLSLVVC